MTFPASPQYTVWSDSTLTALVQATTAGPTGPTGRTGPTGPSVTGPTGPTGPAPTDTYTRIVMPDPGSPIPLTATYNYVGTAPADNSGTMVLPDMTVYPQLWIWVNNSSGHTITVTPFSGQTVGGGSSFTMLDATANQFVKSTATNWLILSADTTSSS